MARVLLWLVALAVAALAAWYALTPSPPAVAVVVRDRRFLLTGGGTGIGREVAQHICAQGGHVYLTGRTERTLRASCDAANAGRSQPCCHFGVHDAATEDGCFGAVEGAVRVLGGLDHLILNHAWGRIVKLMELSRDELLATYRRTFEPNVFGSVCLVHQAVPHLQRSSLARNASAPVKPTVLFVGSISHGYGIPRLGFYSGSKAALLPFLNVWRRELPDVAFVHAAVGFVKTEVAENMPAEAMRAAMPPAVCGWQLLEVLASQRREVFMAAQWDPYVPGVLAHLGFVFAPEWIENAAASQYGREDFVKAYNPPHPLDPSQK